MSISNIKQSDSFSSLSTEYLEKKSEHEAKVSLSFKSLTTEVTNSLKKLGFTGKHSIDSLPIYPKVVSKENWALIENPLSFPVTRGIANADDGSCQICWISVAVEYKVNENDLKDVRENGARTPTNDVESYKPGDLVKGWLRVFEERPGSNWSLDDTFPNGYRIVPIFWSSESISHKKIYKEVRKQFNQLLTNGGFHDKNSRQWNIVGHLRSSESSSNSSEGKSLYVDLTQKRSTSSLSLRPCCLIL